MNLQSRVSVSPSRKWDQEYHCHEAGEFLCSTGKDCTSGNQGNAYSGKVRNRDEKWRLRLVQTVSACPSPRPQPLAAIRDRREDWVVTLSFPALSRVSSSGAARAKTADGNQLREAPRLGVNPGPSPAPADPAKGGGRGRPNSPPLFRSRAPGPGTSGAPDAFQM